MDEVRKYLVKNASDMVGKQYDRLVSSDILPDEIKSPIGIMIVDGETFDVEVVFKLRDN